MMYFIQIPSLYSSHLPLTFLMSVNLLSTFLLPISLLPSCPVKLLVQNLIYTSFSASFDLYKSVQVDLPNCPIKLLVQVLIYEFCPVELLSLFVVPHYRNTLFTKSFAQLNLYVHYCNFYIIIIKIII